MNRVYYVNIKGRTLESRNLKELLARAVMEKRNLDRKSTLQSSSRGCALAGCASNLYAKTGHAAVV